MNTRFESYLSSLTPSKQLLAREAVEQYLKGESDAVDILNSSESIFKKSRWLARKDTEYFVCYYLKNNFSLIKEHIVASGGLDKVMVDKRVVLKEALICGATCMVCVHNHPSGSIRPSREDDNLTLNLRKASEFIGVNMIDHIIVTDTDYYSYRENGKL